MVASAMFSFGVKNRSLQRSKSTRTYEIIFNANVLQPTCEMFSFGTKNQNHQRSKTAATSEIICSTLYPQSIYEIFSFQARNQSFRRTISEINLPARRVPQHLTCGRHYLTSHEGETSITFSEGDLTDIDQPHNDLLLVELQIGTCEVTRVLIDTGSSVDLIFRQTLEKMMVDLKDIKPSSRDHTGFNGSSTHLLGTIRLNVFARGISKLVIFSVIDTKTQYNTILGTPWLHMMKAIPVTYHQCVKFPTRERTVFTLKWNQRLARSMLISDFKSQQVTFLVEPEKKLSPQKEEMIQVSIDLDHPDRTVGIGSELSIDHITELTTFFRANKSTFV
ncbi:hypothetical protein N665_1197s0001 [Sinapis alba]|nr:hypothetical protein N665_1197s0001 [Sinapis alba]